LVFTCDQRLIENSADARFFGKIAFPLVAYIISVYNSILFKMAVSYIFTKTIVSVFFFSVKL
jgi:hypothetical protein